MHFLYSKHRAGGDEHAEWPVQFVLAGPLAVAPIDQYIDPPHIALVGHCQGGACLAAACWSIIPATSATLSISVPSLRLCPILTICQAHGHHPCASLDRALGSSLCLPTSAQNTLLLPRTLLGMTGWTAASTPACLKHCTRPLL